MKRVIIATAFLLVAAFCHAASYRATVTQVVDGDSIVAKIAGKDKKIELAHIDCPELSQPFGEQAAAFVRHKVQGQQVAITTKGHNVAGETKAEVILLKGGKNLNFLLVKEGLAWPGPTNKSTPISNLAKQAQREKIGLWKQADPVEPWTIAGKKAHAIVRFSHALAATTITQEDFSSAPLAGAVAAAVEGDPGSISARDYQITSSAEQAGDYVVISGRISNGPVCENLVISASAKSDSGRYVAIVDAVRFAKGKKSALYDGRRESKVNHQSNPHPQWTVTSVRVNCRS